jgi:hypothetical protein
MGYIDKLKYDKKHKGLSEEKFNELVERNYHSKTDEEKKAIDDKYNIWQTDSSGQVGKFVKDKEIEKGKSVSDILRLIFWPYKKFSASLFWLISLLLWGSAPFIGTVNPEEVFEVTAVAIALILGSRYFAWSFSKDNV